MHLALECFLLQCRPRRMCAFRVYWRHPSCECSGVLRSSIDDMPGSYSDRVPKSIKSGEKVFAGDFGLCSIKAVKTSPRNVLIYSTSGQLSPKLSHRTCLSKSDRPMTPTISSTVKHLSGVTPQISSIPNKCAGSTNPRQNSCLESPKPTTPKDLRSWCLGDDESRVAHHFGTSGPRLL